MATSAMLGDMSGAPLFTLRLPAGVRRQFQKTQLVELTLANIAGMNGARESHKSAQRAMPKGAWTKEEDETVMRLVSLYGPTR